MTAARQLVSTYAEYLAAEATAQVKHDFIRGEVVAMSGGTPEHSLLSAALVRELGLALRGRPCIVFESNMKVRHAARDFACYPDVSVVCGRVERAPDDALALANPVAVIEVLSESTEGFDRGTKVPEYRSMPSISEILLVSQSPARMELQRRRETGHFEVIDLGPSDVVELTSIGVTLPMAVVYRDLDVYRSLLADGG